MNEPVLIDIHDRLATVTLNRPDKANAVNLEMFDTLAAAGRELAADRSVRAVILRGSGENFCAGIDTGIFQDPSFELDDAALAPIADSPANRFQAAAYAWREVPVPVICAIQGAAFGAGLQIALGADIRYAAPDARLSVMEIEWGLIPDMAITTTARNLVAIDKFKEMAWTGRVVGAAEALEAGLVTAVQDDPGAAALQLAETVREKSPDAIRSMKKLANVVWGLPESRALALEAQLQLGLIGTRNQVEAVTARLQNRAPDFED